MSARFRSHPFCVKEMLPSTTLNRISVKQHQGFQYPIITALYSPISNDQWWSTVIGDFRILRWLHTGKERQMINCGLIDGCLLSPIVIPCYICFDIFDLIKMRFTLYDTSWGHQMQIQQATNLPTSCCDSPNLVCSHHPYQMVPLVRSCFLSMGLATRKSWGGSHCKDLGHSNFTEPCLVMFGAHIICIYAYASPLIPHEVSLFHLQSLQVLRIYTYMYIYNIYIYYIYIYIQYIYIQYIYIYIQYIYIYTYIYIHTYIYIYVYIYIHSPIYPYISHRSFTPWSIIDISPWNLPTIPRRRKRWAKRPGKWSYVSPAARRYGESETIFFGVVIVVLTNPDFGVEHWTWIFHLNSFAMLDPQNQPVWLEYNWQGPGG